MKYVQFIAYLILMGCQQQQPKSLIFENAKSTGIISGNKIQEASGLVASANNPGMFWTHNDSDNPADIFLIDEKGNVTCTVHLSGIHNRDWEDIALGSGPVEGIDYLYIGDIGDNNADYDEKILYRIEEPLLPASTRDTTVTKVDKIEFKFSDGRRDSEALIFDPVSKNFYLFSKREPEVNLYKLSAPLSTTGTMNAERVLEKLPFTSIAAADVSEDGSEILAKNYDMVFYWKRQPGETIEDAIKRTPETLPYSREPQGESIAFSRTADGYYTLSERRIGLAQHLYFYKRK